MYLSILVGTQRQIPWHLEIHLVVTDKQHECVLMVYRLDDISDQESVPERLKTFIFGWQLIGCCNDTLERQIDIHISVMEDLLVKGGQKRVLNGRTGLPYLIKKDYVGCRQVSVHTSLVSILVLKLADGYRTENLVRSTEAAHQILKACTVLEGTLEPSGNHTLSDSWQSQQEDAFS